MFQRSPRARGKPKKAQNELLGVEHGERLDTLATGSTGAADPAVAAMGGQHRTTKREGKAAASRNAWKGGMRPLLRELAQEMREQDKIRRGILDSTKR